MDAPLRGGVLPRAGSRWGSSTTIFLAVASFATLLGCLFPLRLPAQTSICAEVKIEIDQKVSLERQAFEAVLKIHNGLDGIPITAVEVNLAFLDENGVAVGSFQGTSQDDDPQIKFFYRTDLMVGIDNVDGSGTVAAQTTAEAHWLIIPTKFSGGTLRDGTVYQIGAHIRYKIGNDGEEKNVDVIPEFVTVRPQPKLRLDYFLPGDVYGDDPFTDADEGLIPFTLGVRITNVGAGTAVHTTIESAQPEIRENAQGLLIDYEIVGSFVDDHASLPSLLIDFGDIAPDISRVGRWLMTTSLSGQFNHFEADYTHADDLGGALTSIFDPDYPPQTYLLTHDVLVDIEENAHSTRDEIRDFLAQAVGAADTDIYQIYESEGSQNTVDYDLSATAVESSSGATLQFGSQGTIRPIYARAAIDTDGQGKSVSAIRTNDGRPVAPANIWFSKRRNAHDPGWLHYLNVFEANPAGCGTTCVYAVTYDGTPEAAISGVVYKDINGSGTQDTGELGLEGVAVTLSDGSSDTSVNSGADGAFHFSGLAGGTYTVAVASVAGYYDGSPTVANANGTPGAGSISGISLAAGEQVSGYKFAKVPQPVQRVADLAIGAFTSSASTPRVGEAFTLTLQVSNAGPDLASADAGVTLPNTIDVLSASTSAGTFTAGTGHWAIGDLAASSTVSLTLQVSAHAEGDASVSASVSSTDAAVLDPAPANNVASQSLHVRPATEVSVTPSFVKESRILVLAGCGLTGSINCTSDRVAALNGYLDARSIEHLVAANAAAFRDELRSGRWNVYWIDNSILRLDDDVIDEVGLAVLRGGTLIYDGIHSSRSAAIDGWTGVSYLGAHGTAASEEVNIVSNPYLDFSGLSVSGAKVAYQLTSGTRLAKYKDDSPAIVMGTHGVGHVFLFSYDLVASLLGNVAYVPLFDQIAMAARPELPTLLTAGAYVPVALHMQNLGGAVSVTETLTVPANTQVVKTVPGVLGSSLSSVSWQNDLAAGATFDSMAGLRVAAGGAVPLAVDVTRRDGDHANLAHQELAVPVRATDDQVSTLIDEVSFLPVSGTADTTLRHDAVTAIEVAVAAHSEGTPNEALTSLLSAEALLDQIVSTTTLASRTDLAWLLQAFEREWYVMLSACGSTSQAPIVDAGVSFIPFGANDGVYLHRTPPNYHWTLGFDTSSTSTSVDGAMALTNSQVYQWTLTYNGSGAATLYVDSGATRLLSQTFSGSVAAQAMETGNGIELYVEALPGSGTTSISIATSALDGSAVSNTISATSTSSTTSGNASLYYYGESLDDGFTLTGTLNLVTSRAELGSTPRLGFRVNAGTLSCKNTSR